MSLLIISAAMLNQSKLPIKAVLFDLDGTLVDTAHDLVEALNHTLLHFGYSKTTTSHLRQYITGGIKHMLYHTSDLDSNHPKLQQAVDQTLEHYLRTSGNKSILFPGVEETLNHLNQANIPWGIVTNKSKRFSEPLIKKLGLSSYCRVLVSGDTFETAKPHPLPLLYACQKLGTHPINTLYIGDYRTDVEASKAAYMPHVCVTYGYYPAHEHPYNWFSQYIAHHPSDILKFL